MLSARALGMQKWVALALGLLLGAGAARTVRVERAHACEPTCAPDKSMILQVAEVAGSDQAVKFWGDLRVRDAVITPQYLLFAVGEGQIELGYEK